MGSPCDQTFLAALDLFDLHLATHLDLTDTGRINGMQIILVDHDTAGRKIPVP